MGAKLGLAGKVYRLSTGTRASWGAADSDGFNAGPAPSNLDEIIQVKNITRTIEKGEADASIRGHNGWGAVLSTLKRGEVQLEMVYDDADADMIALHKVFNSSVGATANTTIGLAVLTGDKATVGVRGLWADFEVLHIENSEPLEEAQMVTITVKPSANTSVAPEMVKVT